MTNDKDIKAMIEGFKVVKDAFNNVSHNKAENEQQEPKQQDDEACEQNKAYQFIVFTRQNNKYYISSVEDLEKILFNYNEFVLAKDIVYNELYLRISEITRIYKLGDD